MRNLIAGGCAVCLMAFTGCAGSSWRAPEHRLEVVPQSAWGGTPPDGSRGRLHRITRITLHHGGTPFTRDRDVAQHLRNLQAWSRRDRMWIDIPYHFVIDLEGRVYEARDLKFAGDTNTEYDPAGHALIVVLGDYEESEPTGAQLHALADTMAMLAWRFGLGVEAIGAHRDFSTRTACPGKNLYRVLQDGSLAAAVKARLAAWQAHTEARATQTRPDAQ